MTPPRRKALRIIVGCALTPLLAACGPAPKLRIASHVWPGYELLFLARAEDWLDENRVTLVETASASESMKALAEGRADGAALTLDEVLRVRATGLPLSVVLAFDISAGADVLLARSGIGSIAELKGKRIGFEQGAVGMLMLHQALMAGGINAIDVVQVLLPIDQHEFAWRAGDVDALVTFEPVASRLAAAGARRLFDSREIPDTIVDVLAIRTPMLDGDHADAVRYLIAAQMRALAHLGSHPQDSAYRMASRLNLSPDQALASFRGLVLPDRSYNRRLLDGPSPILRDSARRLNVLMAASGILSREDDLAGLLRPEFLP